MSKAKKVKPVRAWGIRFWDGSLWKEARRTREAMRKDAVYSFADGFDVIRVRIVPVTKARGK